MIECYPEPKNSETLINKGVVLANLRYYTEAIEYYDRALDIEPTNVNALYNKGVVLEALCNYTETMEYIIIVLAINPNHTDALNKIDPFSDPRIFAD